MSTIFKKIIDKEIPATIIYEDEDFLAFNDVAEALRNAGFILLESDIDYVPSLEVTPSEEDLASLKKMIDILENDDDVQKVYHNCAISLDD